MSAWRPTRHGQESLRQALLAFLAAREDACLRSCAAGPHHGVGAWCWTTPASGCCSRCTRGSASWLQLGGHCEPDDRTLVGAALREATEESGIEGLRIEPTPLHVDVHPVTCSLGVPTRHLDVRFLVHAPAGAMPVRSDESDDLRWWSLEEAADEALDDLRDMFEAARVRLAGAGSRVAP